jgi:hypothetical protein
MNERTTRTTSQMVGHLETVALRKTVRASGRISLK